MTDTKKDLGWQKVTALELAEGDFVGRVVLYPSEGSWCVPTEIEGYNENEFITVWSDDECLDTQLFWELEGDEVFLVGPKWEDVAP